MPDSEAASSYPGLLAELAGIVPGRMWTNQRVSLEGVPACPPMHYSPSLPPDCFLCVGRVRTMQIFNAMLLQASLCQVPKHSPVNFLSLNP